LLVDLYFINMNSFLPLLHRPTFEKALREGVHHRDDGFAAVVLLVSAVGSRFSDDPRVILEGTNSPHSAGWSWFHQVQMVRRSLFSPPSLYDLQVYCVSCIFVGLSAHHEMISNISYLQRSCKDPLLRSHVGRSLALESV
jgi:hypothetical protein